MQMNWVHLSPLDINPHLGLISNHIIIINIQCMTHLTNMLGILCITLVSVSIFSLKIGKYHGMETFLRQLQMATFSRKQVFRQLFPYYIR